MNGFEPVLSDQTGTTQDDSAFARLIHPLPVSSFFHEYWERRPLVIERAAPDYFASLLTVPAIDGILASESVRHPQCTLVLNGQQIPADRYTRKDDLVGHNINVEALYAEYKKGATIIINRMQSLHAPLNRLCRRLENVFHHRFHTNVYATPPGSRGFAYHYDTHDVFVLQIHGSKRWKICEGPVRLPDEKLHYDSSRMRPGKQLISKVLRSGDMMYLPRGFIHRAEATREGSVHVTLGVKVYTWADILTQAVATEVMRDPRLRRSLPLGFASASSDPDLRSMFKTHIRRLSKSADLDAAIESLAENLITRNPANQARGSIEFKRAGRLKLDDTLILTTGTHVLRTGKRQACLMSNGKAIRFPRFVVPALKWISNRERFRPRDIPGEMDSASKIVLAERLLAEGFAKIVKAAIDSPQRIASTEFTK